MTVDCSAGSRRYCKFFLSAAHRCVGEAQARGMGFDPRSGMRLARAADQRALTAGPIRLVPEHQSSTDKTMTAALTKALAMHDPDWLTAGLDGSYLRTIRGVMYAVLVARNGSVLAVYRVSRKRMNVQLAEFWPRALVEEFL